MTRLIAFYLPQYHPIAENDQWWGKGFTEWTNVAKAKPLFKGHYQPHIPADLGFYDLRVPETRQAQADLAREYGIYGFCYYHYWFNGKQLLERPFQEVLESGKPDFPFCLCWANEPWSKRWLGEEKQVLQEQKYSTQDDYNHIYWLLTAFQDKRYITVNGRPLFLIYRPTHLPNPKMTCDTFRTEAIRNGISEPYLVGIDAWCRYMDFRKFGFDSTLNFEPQLGILPDYKNDNFSISKILRNLKLGVMSGKYKVYDYESARSAMFYNPDFPIYRSIMVGWDNSPRRGNNGIIIVNSTPDKFQNGLSFLLNTSLHKKPEERLIFLNAWNEWAEGNYLEPDIIHGHNFLQAIQNAIIENSRSI